MTAEMTKLKGLIEQRLDELYQNILKGDREERHSSYERRDELFNVVEWLIPLAQDEKS